MPAGLHEFQGAERVPRRLSKAAFPDQQRDQRLSRAIVFLSRAVFFVTSVSAKNDCLKTQELVEGSRAQPQQFQVASSSNADRARLTCVCVYIYVCMYVCMYACIYIYIYNFLLHSLIASLGYCIRSTHLVPFTVHRIDSCRTCVSTHRKCFGNTSGLASCRQPRVYTLASGTA